MKRHYFLGSGANYKNAWQNVFVHGGKKDREALEIHLSKRYGGEAILTKNGRSGLAIALKALCKRGDKVMINGFTCYAVVEALKAAGVEPIYTDINAKDLNFDIETLEEACGREDHPERIRAIIIQNTLGNPIDIISIEKFAHKHNLMIIEDLAHSAGVKYADGREAGTVGVATILSFGKEKSIDTISGGAVVMRTAEIQALGILPNDLCNFAKFHPSKRARCSDALRARFYPVFGAMYRGLSHVHLHGVLMKCLLKIHWVERSADNRLDMERRIANFEAKLALRQMKSLTKSGEGTLREFYLVDNRDEVLKMLREAGYFFDGVWYEKPVSPARYYKKIRYPEDECPVATKVAESIINFPKYYNKQELAPAYKILENVGMPWKETK